MDDIVITSPVEAEAAGAQNAAREDAGSAKTEEAQAPERKEDFERLIRGEYKAEFDERVQRIIDKRFKETKTLKEQAERARPVLDLLRQKFGEEDDGKLLERLRAEGADAEDGALKGENERLRAENRALSREQKARETAAKWQADAREAQKLYPGFDMRREMGDERFSSLLRAGVDVKTAYEATHHSALLEEAMRYTAERVRDKTVNDIRARGARPEENGALGRGATGVAPLKVENMTRAQREEIEKRCARGEKVYFN